MKKQVIGITLMLIFLFCMLFANFYVFRAMQDYGLEAYIYDKLLVAYNIGGKNGLEAELKKMLAETQFPRQLAIVKGFEIKLKTLKDPAAFLGERVMHDRDKIVSLRNWRLIAIGLMIIIFVWRLLLIRKNP